MHPTEPCLDATGLQPFLFIAGFTLAIVTTGFRDNHGCSCWVPSPALPRCFSSSYILKSLDLSIAWDVLFTGSGYFAKTKIFGTVAVQTRQTELNCLPLSGRSPSRWPHHGWSSLQWGLRHRNGTALVFGVWVFVATFMAWNAARFMFNATPIMAILGAAGIVALAVGELERPVRS